MIVKIGKYSFKKSDEGWVWKAEEPKKLTTKQHDLPRFRAQIDLEKVFKEDLSKKVLQSTKEIRNLLID